MTRVLVIDEDEKKEGKKRGRKRAAPFTGQSSRRCDLGRACRDVPVTVPTEKGGRTDMEGTDVIREKKGGKKEGYLPGSRIQRR